MNRILTVTLSTLVLTACAAGYDRTALPDASVSVRQASLGCEVKWAVQEIKTYSEMAACSLAAERRFFTAIKLRKMNKFEAYAASYQTLAAARDAGRVPDRQANRRAEIIRRDFYAECRCTREPVINSAYLPSHRID